MKVSILIVSYTKHFPWLKQCLKSIEKYASGFFEVCVCVPYEDVSEMSQIGAGYHGAVPLRVMVFEDWPDKGMIRHMHLIMHSDQCCPEADFVCHLDSDCIVIEPLTPGEYFVNGKPVLMHARYDWVCKMEPGIRKWQEVTYNALGWTPDQETMRRHPAVHYRDTYLLVRQCVERNVGRLIADYMKDQENAYPQGWCEFNTLGAYAWRFLSQKYHWINQELEPRPKDKIFQLWSHGALDAPMEVWHNDQKVTVIPNEVFAKYL